MWLRSFPENNAQFTQSRLKVGIFNKVWKHVINIGLIPFTHFCGKKDNIEFYFHLSSNRFTSKVLRYSWTCVAFQDGVEIGWLDLMRPHFEKIWGLEIHKLEFCAKCFKSRKTESSSNSHVWSLWPFPTEGLIIVFVNMF